jgi:hypothetical protein
MGKLKQLFTSREVPLDIALQMHHAIPLNAALWGCDTWVLQDSNASKLKVFTIAQSA